MAGLPNTNQHLGDKLRYFKKDAFTTSNFMTLGRLIITPHVADNLEKDPQAWWVPAAAVALTDNLDGIGARGGDRYKWLRRLGFRTSEFGRRADPVTDRVVGYKFIKAGMKAGVVPETLGNMAINQKAGIIAQVTYASLHGADIRVTKQGKHAEFATNLSLGLLIPTETIEDPLQRSLVRGSLMVVAALGISAATDNTRHYLREVPAEQ